MLTADLLSLFCGTFLFQYKVSGDTDQRVAQCCVLRLLLQWQ